jgi:hypothetical protein
VGPITGARVEVVDGPDAGAVATSSVSGYSLSNINWGTFTLRASKSGYTPVECIDECRRPRLGVSAGAADRQAGIPVSENERRLPVNARGGAHGENGE